MRHAARWHRGAKLIGLALCMVMLLAWVASAWFYADVGKGRWHAVVTFGQLRVNRSFRLVDEPSFAGCGLHESGLDWSFAVWKSASHECFNIPLWAPFLLMASGTGYLMWKDRTMTPGGCPNCGYSRDGLASNACCPECGKPKN